MAGIYKGHDPEYFQKIMGRGGVIGSRQRTEPRVTKQPEKQTNEDTPEPDVNHGQDKR